MLRWLLAASLLWVSTATATEPTHFRVALGAAKPHSDQWAGVLTLGLERDWRPLFGGRLSWDGMLMAIHPRNGDGEEDLTRDVQVLAGGLRWRSGGFFQGFATGLATPRTRAISGPVQFVTTVGYDWGNWAVLVQHISNAGFKGRNHGETMLMLEWVPTRQLRGR